MTEPIRREPGPRDWSPSSSGFGASTPPFPRLSDLPEEPAYSERLYRAPADRLRGIGLLAVLVGLASVVYALRPTENPQGGEWAFVLTGPVAILLGCIGIARMLRLNLLDRITSSIATGLGTIGTVALVASLAGVWTGIPLGTAAAPQPVAPIGTTTTTDELAELSQVLGTASYLLRQDAANFGSYPTTLALSSDNLIVLASGTVAVPAGTMMNYALVPETSSYVLALTSPSGLTVYLDSSVGYIESYTTQR